VLRQLDGKIVAVGNSFKQINSNTSESSFALARYLGH